MKIVVITSSPRRDGNSNHLAGRFMDGAEAAGHSVVTFDAARHKISPCLACDHCRREVGVCVFRDGMDLLRPHLLEADMVVFVTPTYYYGMSAQMKTVIDRFYAINDRLKEVPKKAVLIATCADDAEMDLRPMVDSYKAVIGYLGWEDAGTLVATSLWKCGEAESSQFNQQAYDLGKNI